MFKAAIFDIDGLMIDSDPIHSVAFCQVMKENGVKPILNKNGLVHLAGVRETENWEYLEKKFRFKADIPTLIRRRNEIYQQLIKGNVKLRDGLGDFLRELRVHKIKMAVASSSLIEQIKTILDSSDTRSFFKAVVSGHFVKRSKPFPDIFLEAAKRIHTLPKEAVVFEDAESGVEAGKRAKMRVIAVPNAYTKNQDLSRADLIVDSFLKLNFKKVAALF